MNQATDPNSPSSSGYEKSDVNLRKTIVAAVAIVVVVALSLVVLSEYYLSVKEEYIYEMTLKPESAALRDIRAREDEILYSYKLLDSTSGAYQIPIDRAMELIAEEAFRSRTGGNQ